MYSYKATTFNFFVSFNSDFDFDIIVGLFFFFLGLDGLFFCGSKTVLGSTHVVEQLSFSMIS